MLALGLLTLAAACHAGWNLLVKSSGHQGPEFVWLYGAIPAPASLVLLGWAAGHDGVGNAWWAGLVSMALHTTYAVVLQWAYKAGDFSVVYSVSRGMAPVLVVLVTIPWLGSPSTAAWCGVAAVLVGVLLMDRVSARHNRGSWPGLLVAACSCAYTLWDGYAVATLGARVLPYLAVANLGQLALLTLVLIPRRGRLGTVLASWRQAVPIALLAPASYGLVLVALSLAPVGTVAVGRTLNVVVGNLFGVAILRERITLTSAAGLAAVVTGVLLVST
ncbi:hypothetical protein FB561_3792 [Kribbella amoyensis]|uniref:EamA domain-containing protein n=1 Tax=Kribbella amoyensis TaxID=996641 RepID=A0A561BUT8_9ACTN|nr:hypothetical protein [Kribbella amoyensis]TWD82656.1 hypothetical protein FB561_3792 [Kribbella amoyensis]